MNSLIKKVSHIVSIILMFIVSSFLYFDYKGYVFENGKVVLTVKSAEAYEKKERQKVLPSNININASQKYAIGSPDAPLVAYEYSSFDCPHCADFHLNTLSKIKKDYVDNGLLKIVFVNFPLTPNAMKVAMLSECMSYENYYPFVSKMFDAQRKWIFTNSDKILYEYAEEYGLTETEAKNCMVNDNVARDIISDRQEGIQQLDINATPALLVSGKDGNEILYGYRSYEVLKEYLEHRLQNNR